MIASKLSFEQEVTRHDLTKLRVEVEWEPARFDDRVVSATARSASTIRWGWKAATTPTPPAVLLLDPAPCRERAGRRRCLPSQQAFLRWRTTDRMTMALALRYADRDAWLLHRSNGVFATFEAKDSHAARHVELFRQRPPAVAVGLSMVAIKADAQHFYRMADTPDYLVPIDRAPTPSDDLSISRMSLQLRYRWEIAPLSDLFVVYRKTPRYPVVTGRASPTCSRTLSRKPRREPRDQAALSFR